MPRPLLKQLAASGATNGQVPTFNSTTQRWEPSTPASASGAARLFTSTASASDINTALADATVGIVYLSPGTYSFTTTAIVVPAGKWLIGAYRYADSAAATGRVRLEFSGNPAGGAVQVAEGAHAEGFAIVKTGTLGTVAGLATTGSTERAVRVIAVVADNWLNGFLTSTVEAQSVTLEDCTAIGSTTGFNIASVTAASERAYVRLRGCIARTNGTGFLIAVDMSTGAGGTIHVHECESKSNTSHGFNCTVFGTGSLGGLARSWFTNNLALANGGDGIRFPSGSAPTATISGNRSEENTGFGFLFAGAVGSTHKIVLGSSNISISNTAGDWSFANPADEIRGIGSLQSEDLLGHGTIYINSGTVDVTTLQDILNNDDIHMVLLADMEAVGSAAIDLGVAATGLSVPSGKRLIGAGNISEATSLPRDGFVRFIYQGTGTAIAVTDGAHCEGIAIEQTGTVGTGIGILCAGNGQNIVKCEVRDFLTGITTGPGGAGETIIRDCRAIACTTGILQDQNVGAARYVLIDNCTANTGTTGFDIDGPGGEGYVIVRNCRADTCGGAGFNQRNQWGSATSSGSGGVRLEGCNADDCVGDGFDLNNNPHFGTVVTGCRAQGNTGTGFNCSSGTTLERRPYIGNCFSTNNGTEYSIDGTWNRGTLNFTKPSGGTTSNTVPDGVERLLAVHSALNLKTSATTTLLTAGTSEVFIITRVDVSVRTWSDGAGATPFTADPTMAITTAAGDIVAVTTLTSFGAGGSTNQIHPLRPTGTYKKVTATNVVQAVVVAATGGVTLNADVHVWGYVAQV